MSDALRVNWNTAALRDLRTYSTPQMRSTAEQLAAEYQRACYRAGVKPEARELILRDAIELMTSQKPFEQPRCRYYHLLQDDDEECA